MSKKAILTIVVILLSAGGLYAYESNFKKVIAPEIKIDTNLSSQQQKDSKVKEIQKTTEEKPVAKQAEQKPAQQSEARFSDGSEIESLDIAVFEVQYNGKNFSPSSLEIKAGDYVIFKNTSSEDFWPASNNHPEHLLYPEFDTKKSLAPGSQYKFNFLKKGTWAYHNHLKPEITGTIIVK